MTSRVDRSAGPAGAPAPTVAPSPALATPEALFRAYFFPLYPADAQSDLARARATDANPGNNPALVAHLDDAARVFVAGAAQMFPGRHASLALDFTDASVHRLSAALTRERRDAWARTGAAGSPDNELFNVVVHGAAYVGACITAAHAGAWRVRRPLWESLVYLESRAGKGDLAVFHWWLKSLTDDGFDRGITLADRYRAHVENPTARPESLPILAPPDRRLPRLVKPRYDTLYKWTKAHLPELRDLGEAFPSPERFEELAFASLDFALVGGGRMLLLSGANAHGLHLFWLTTSGFEKSAFFPCEAFPEPRVKVDGDTVRAIVSVAGKPLVHEVLWWGP
jgi:hypothetical protein